MSASDEAANPETKPGMIEKVKQIVTGGNAEQPSTAPATPSPLKFKRVHIIVNPTSGQTGLNLPALNKVLKDLEIDWEMFVLHSGAEATERAKQAVAAGVDAIVVYGGDGTVLEVASGVVGSEIPLVIIPGGTANVLSVELGIPADQTQAALLLGGVPNAVRALDMGALAGAGENGDDLLFFHLGMGIEGAMHENADRDAKDRAGMFAYVLGALKTLSNPTMAHYKLTLDGEVVEADGINCMITNFGSVGVPGITLSHAVDMSDGLIDVIIFQDANIGSLIGAAASVVTSGDMTPSLLQWQAREVTVAAKPVQPIVVDGELIDIGKVAVRVVPKAARVVVPAPAAT